VHVADLLWVTLTKDNHLTTKGERHEYSRESTIG